MSHAPASMDDPLPRTLDTARLHLRQPLLSDARMLIDHWAGDPEVARYMLFATYPTDALALAESFIGACQANWLGATGHRPWVISERAAPAIAIGMFGVSPGSGPHAWEVGYVLGRRWWGRGYASELVRAVTATLFSDSRVWRVFAPTHIDNAASQRVLEKCGFSREATLRRYLVFPAFGAEPQDCSLWSRTRDDLALLDPMDPLDPTDNGAS